MDLTLTLGYQEQNDNKAIILTDTSNYDYTLTPNLVSGSVTVTNTLYEIVAQSDIIFSNFGAANNNVGTRFVWDGAGQTLLGSDELKQVTALVT